MQPELLLDARAELGESPSWDAAARLLYWVDIYAGAVHTFHPQAMTDTSLFVGEAVGCVAPCRNRDLIMALKSGFASLNPATQILTHLLNPEPHLTGNRFNDGKCDPVGRFIAGTMDNNEKEASGGLYSYAPDGRLKTLLTGIRISNGLAWSPDGQTIYHIDTPSRQVRAFDYEPDRGDIANPRPVINVPLELGWPDGMTSDAEGMLWVAMWGGAKLTRWNPSTGDLLESIPIPALNVTSCVFGGETLGDLYITSARKGMNAEEMDEYPLSGGLFRVKTAIQGMPTYAFGG